MTPSQPAAGTFRSGLPYNRCPLELAVVVVFLALVHVW